jgi:predicted lipoprotein
MATTTHSLWQAGSWGLIAALAAIVAVPPGGAGCAGPLEQPTGSTTELPAGDVLTETLAYAGDEAVLPTLRAFSQSLADLEVAVADWQAAPTDDGARAAAQQAWVDAMDAWQQAELMQLGPAGSSLTALGGLDLRDRIYSWPSINPCRVDQETVEGDYAEPGFADSELVNVLGLDALEQLLFSGDGNTCPGQVVINAEGTWDALGSQGVAANRAAYAAVLVDDLTLQADTLVAEWEGGFAADLAAGGGVYGSQQEALNALFDAVFYLEKTTKDAKLATPLGIVDCSTGTCPEAAEALPSGTSHLWVRSNLQGFRSMFVQGERSGFDALLVDLGHEDLATEVVARLDAADAAAAALEVPVDAAVDSDTEALQALHDAVKGVADLLKGDIATVLTLQIPAEAAGDND